MIDKSIYNPVVFGRIRYALEVLDVRLFDELMPIISDHLNEIEQDLGMGISVNKQGYMQLQNSDKLFVIVCRLVEDMSIVGYSSFFVDNHPHYRHNICAIQNAFYVKKEYASTRTPKRMLDFSEEVLSKVGVDIIIQHAKVKNMFGKFLKKASYSLYEEVYIKRLEDGFSSSNRG